MFGTDNTTSAETFIGPSVHVQGDFKSEGNIQVEGAVSGTITTVGNLTVGERANIHGNIEAANAYMAGFLKGNIIIHERLELSATAIIEGDISTKILVMTEGAKINGKCQMNATAVAPATSPVRANKKPAPII